ncbi:MAG: hypothetical protein ACK4WC_12745, partial [Rubrimonas sp.]
GVALARECVHFFTFLLLSRVAYRGVEERRGGWWCVEVEGGGRFWIYREGLHDDGRGGEPPWFLHGIFA